MKFRPRQPSGPPAVGTMGTLGGPNGEICFVEKLRSGRLFLPRFKNSEIATKLKSRSRFLDVGGINLHSVSFCRASFIHDAMICEAGCPAFSIIRGRSLWWRDPVSMGLKSSRIWTAHPSCAGAPRYVVWILGNRDNFFGAWRSVLSA